MLVEPVLGHKWPSSIYNHSEDNGHPQSLKVGHENILNNILISKVVVTSSYFSFHLKNKAMLRTIRIIMGLTIGLKVLV